MMTVSVAVQMLKRVRVVADTQEEACEIAKTLISLEHPEWDVYADVEDTLVEGRDYDR